MTSASGTATRRTERRSFRYVRMLAEGPSAVSALPAEHASAIPSKPTAALRLRRIVADSTATFSAPATSGTPRTAHELRGEEEGGRRGRAPSRFYSWEMFLGLDLPPPRVRRARADTSPRRRKRW